MGVNEAQADRAARQPDAVRVLLVDDDVAVMRAYQRALARSGWSVETASNGKEGIECVKRASFDVILSDIVGSPGTELEFAL